MAIRYGADYYPEHWPKERWDTDIRLMQELGLDVVRLAEFSWGLLETEEGVFDFAWLDDIISRLGVAGIKVVLGTPSAAPPAWLIEKDPSILPIDSEGKQTAFGGRHHACQSNKTLRDASVSYVEKFAAHYAQNPNVIGWQIDNELGNSHHDVCHCESCTEGFRTWLEARYGTIEAVNENWGTNFWSQNYNHFGQITTPKWLLTGHNPSQELDWRRFKSDLILDFHRLQHDVIRRLHPGAFITHNLMGFADTVDYHELGEQLDFASHDQYPGGFFRPPLENLAAFLAAELDMVRGTKDMPFWIMEQQSGVTGWQIMGRAPKPGQLSMWSMQTVAHGADAIVYFRWRVASIGTEQYWHGILPHSGIPGRNYYELQALIRKTGKLMTELQGAMPKNRAAMLFSYEQKHAMAIQPNNRHLNYQAHFQKIYDAFHEKQVPMDIIGWHADFSAYDVLVAPLQYLMWPELKEKYEAYARGGGTLVLDMRAGTKHRNNINYIDGPLPGVLADLTGIEIPEYDPLEGETVDLKWGNDTGSATLWADLIRVTADNVEVLAEYASDFYAGTAAATLHPYGEGQVIYIGTELDRKLYGALVDRFIAEDRVTPLGTADTGVELVVRETADKRYLFCMNHGGDSASYQIDATWKPYFEGQTNEIEAYGYHVYTQAK